MTQFLLEHGSDVFAVDEDGDTPLHSASDARVAQIVLDWCHHDLAKVAGRVERSNMRSKLLLARNGEGNTPYQAATQRLWKAEDESAKVEHQATVALLYSYVAPLAVPEVGQSPCCDLKKEDESAIAAAVSINPKLTVEQQSLVEGLRGVLETTDVHQIAYQILGYLCISDVTD